MIRTALWLPVGLLFVACSNENTLVEANESDVLLTIDDPAPASYRAAGEDTVRGQVAGMRGVTVNGHEAVVSAGTYTAGVIFERGVNIVEATSLDELGNPYTIRHGLLAGEFAVPGRPLDNAIALRLNEDGLESLMGFASEMVTPAMLAPVVSGANPVYTESFAVGGTDIASIAANITGVSFGYLSLLAEPTDGQLELSIWIPDFRVDLRADINLAGWEPSVSAYVAADKIEISAGITLDTEDGKLKVGMVDPDLNFVGLVADTSLIPGDFETYLFVDGVVDFIEDMVLEQVNELVPTLLEERLGSFVLDVETELMGKRLEIDGDFHHASVDADGIALGMNLNVAMQGGNGGAPGYLKATGGEPTIDTQADLAMAMSDDLLNSVLFEAWGAKLLEMEMSTADGSLSADMLQMLKATEGSVSISADMAPVIVEREGGLVAQVAEMQVILETPGGEFGEYLRAAIAAEVPVGARVSDGVLKLDVGTPVLTIEVRENDWGASDDTVTALLEDMLPMEMLTGLLADLSFPLPTFEGMGIDRASVERDLTGSHTGIELRLD